MYGLTHWGRATHICVSKLIIIGSDNREVLLHVKRERVRVEKDAGVTSSKPVYAVALFTGVYTSYVAISTCNQLIYVMSLRDPKRDESKNWRKDYG